jgi:hypothetical protein
MRALAPTTLLLSLRWTVVAPSHPRSESALQQAPASHDDPRQQRACHEVFGVFPAHTAASPRLRTVEDEIAGRAMAPALGHRLRGRMGPCAMPYGLLANTTRGHARGERVFYVEVPKAGSSTVKEILEKSFGATHALPAQRSNAPFGVDERAFTVVREPLERLISGYGTLIARLTTVERERARRPAGDARRPAGERSAPSSQLRGGRGGAVARFERFVELLTTRGDALLREDQGVRPYGCLWGHVMSQMWFLAPFAGEIEYVAHVEELEPDLEHIRTRFALAPYPARRDAPDGARSGASARARGAPYSQWSGNSKNAREGAAVHAPTKEELMRHAPRALARLVHYLRQDYACLQYPVPNITEAGALA